MSRRLQSITGLSDTVQTDARGGEVVVDKSTPLKLLHYFDGRFLRAPDLRLEQLGMLNQVYLSNLAGGAGFVHGFDTRLAGGDGVTVGPGLGFDFLGRPLYLLGEVELSIGALIDGWRAEAQGTLGPLAGALSAERGDGRFGDCEPVQTPGRVSTVADDDLFLLTVCFQEAYCGEEDVYGKLCSEACISSKDKSLLVQGVNFRILPLNLTVALKQSGVELSQKHWRSRVASAYFEQERRRTPSHISRQGLASEPWCLGAEAEGGNCLPLAVVGRSGGVTRFLDAWTCRRERMETPPDRYWAWRMARRPWSVFLAQVLQFQCQLRGCFTAQEGDDRPEEGFDPCADERKVAADAAQSMSVLLRYYEEVAGKFTELEAIEAAPMLAGNNFADGFATVRESYLRLLDIAEVRPSNRLLINCGIVEVPSAGYLPVNKSTRVSINEQVRRLFGEGVNLCFCTTRPDYIPHALVEAQSMERICLLSGIDDPSRKPDVEILVPNGIVEEERQAVSGQGYRTRLALDERVLSLGLTKGKAATTDNRLNAGAERLALRARQFTPALVQLSGAGRSDRPASGGYSFYFAGRSDSGDRQSYIELERLRRAEAAPSPLAEAEASFRNSGNTPAGMAISGGPAMNTMAVAKSLKLNLLQQAGSAIWVELKIDVDPFSMLRGASTDVSARIIFASTEQRLQQTTRQVHQRTVTATLVVEQIIGQAGQRKLRARFTGSGIWTSEMENANGEQTLSELVNFDERLVITEVGGASPGVQVAVLNPSFFAGLDNVQLLFERRITAAGQSIFRAAVQYRAPGDFTHRDDVTGAAMVKLGGNDVQEILLLEGDLVDDGEVLEPGNDWHSASTSAISSLATALERDSFSEEAGRLLFPPPEPVSEELRIRGTECWVFFRRKREKICEREAPAPVVVPTRVYRVYHVHLEPETNIPELVEQLKASPDTLNRFNARAVTRVEFQPGVATVKTNQEDIRDDWETSVKVDAEVHIGLIAGEGPVDAEGPVLAEARLDSVTNIIRPVSDPADTLALFEVADIPASLAAGEVDGVIVYFTRAVSTICHTVYRVPTRDFGAFIESAAAWAGNPGDVTLPVFMRRQGGQQLSAEARFLEGTTDFFGESTPEQLAAAWQLANNGPLTRGVVFAGEPDDTSPGIAQQQTSKIGSVVGGNVSPEEVVRLDVPRAALSPCPNVSVLLVEEVCNDVYLYTPRVTDLEAARRMLREVIQTVGLTPEMLGGDSTFIAAAASPWRRLGPVDFFRNTGNFADDAEAQLLATWNGLLGGAPAGDIRVDIIAVGQRAATEANTAAELAVAQQQSGSVAARLGVQVIGGDGLVNGGDGAFPSPCRAITILFAPINNPSQPGMVATGEAPAANMVMVNPDNVGFVAVNAQPETRIVRVMPSRTVTEAVGTGETEQPTATTPAEDMEVILTEGIRFENEELVTDESFEAAVERLGESSNRIRTIEVVSVEAPVSGESDPRAERLLEVLRERGVATPGSRVRMREATEEERVEIVRSGFELDRAIRFRPS